MFLNAHDLVQMARRRYSDEIDTLKEKMIPELERRLINEVENYPYTRSFYLERDSSLNVSHNNWLDKQVLVDYVVDTLERSGFEVKALISGGAIRELKITW